MPEPFKTWFNVPLIEAMGEHLVRAWPDFDRARFESLACDGLDALELKERAHQIRDALDATLPDYFPAAAALLVATLHPAKDRDVADMTTDDAGVAGWAVMPMGEYLALRGGAHLELSLEALREMTMRFSSEFAVRPFLDRAPGRAVEIIGSWIDDPNRHVRRLVSEGTRPRLPWGMRLPKFVADPAPLLPLLQRLRDDPEEYVRRSVANNLNDIAKDHPDLVAALANEWLTDAPPEREKLVRHALRSLVKQGHEGALAALGFDAPRVTVKAFKVTTPTVTLGTALHFDLVLESEADARQDLILDYAVHHQRANGTLSPKVFKWKTVTLAPCQTLTETRRHPMRKVTTRTYYPGAHKVEVLVNGKSVAEAEFSLETD